MRTKAVIRLIAVAILTVNAFLTAKGINPIPFDETLFAEIATQIAAGASIVWAWYKDAPITKAGRKGHAVTKAIKQDGYDEF